MDGEKLECFLQLAMGSELPVWVSQWNNLPEEWLAVTHLVKDAVKVGTLSLSLYCHNWPRAVQQNLKAMSSMSRGVTTAVLKTWMR